MNDTLIFNYSTNAINSCGYPPQDSCLYQHLCTKGTYGTYIVDKGLMLIILYVLVSFLRVHIINYLIKKNILIKENYYLYLYNVEKILLFGFFVYTVVVVYLNF